MKDEPRELERLLNNPVAWGLMRTGSLAIATKWANSGKTFGQIILGSDGLFWVSSTNRQVGMLVRAGYSLA